MKSDVKIQPKLEASWLEPLGDEFQKEYFQNLKLFLQKEKQAGTVIYPPGSQIFAALDFCPFEQTKVVVLGQDPYHGPGQAHGLCFSVPEGIAVPPSLVNIYKELQADIGFTPPRHGNLEKWAKQGVLLLNNTLTVKAHMAASHQGRGWELFTDAIVAQLNEKKENLVFLLWGASAKKKGANIDGQKHLVLTAPHPSPLSAHRGFLGCKHFSQTNSYLNQKGLTPIDWSL